MDYIKIGILIVKIGGLFQAPARADRYVTKSFNPGGGMFANTTSTGRANALADSLVINLMEQPPLVLLK